jgi:hypothetical protein
MSLFGRVMGFFTRLLMRTEEFLLGKEEVPMMSPPVERKPQIDFPEIPNIQLPQIDPRLVLLILAIIGSISYIAYVQYINMKLREGEFLPSYEGDEEEEEKKPSRFKERVKRVFKISSPPYRKGKEEEKLLEELKGKEGEAPQAISIVEVIGRISQVIEEGVQEAMKEMKEEGLTTTKKRQKVDIEKAQKEVEEMLATTPLYVDDALKELTPEEEQLIAERAGSDVPEETPKKGGRKRKKQLDEDIEDKIFEEEAEAEDKAEDFRS